MWVVRNTVTFFQGILQQNDHMHFSKFPPLSQHFKYRLFELLCFVMSAGLIGLRLIGVDCNFYISIKLGGLDYKLCRILEAKR